MDTLFLDTDASKLVKVHPVVLFSILDHFMRRNEGQVRVIGTLLGSISDSGTVEIKNCFPVPHKEEDNQVAVGRDFNEQMLDLHQRVNPREEIVGWYATSTQDGEVITDSSALIHEFYSTQTNMPVHLVVDTALLNSTVGIKAFVSVPLSIADTALKNQFQQIKLEMEFLEAERIAVDLMLKGRTGKFDASNLHLSTLHTDTENLEKSIRRLHGMLGNVSHYVKEVLAGNVTPNDDIGRHIAETLAVVPQITPEAFDKVFNSSLQDLLMVSFLSNLTKTQLAITEKLLATSDLVQQQQYAQMM